MTIEQILADIKQRKFQPVYFLHGDESFYIDLIGIRENRIDRSREGL